MRAHIIEEPPLLFGGGHRHIDIRFGLLHGQPFDAGHERSPKQITMAMVGDAASVAGARTWIDRWRRGVAEKSSKKPNLFVRFPGCGAGSPLPADVIVTDSLTRVLSSKQIQAILTPSVQDQVVRLAVAAIMEEIDDLVAKGGINVICCAVPAALLEAMDTLEPTNRDRRHRIDFRGLLKAQAMRHPIPVQIVLPETYGGPKRSRSAATARPRQLQDEATRVWNLYNALYYKAGGTPWRLGHDPAELDTCFIGVSFYQDRQRDAVETSVAQVFNERGEGVIVRGGQALISKHDRQPHLTEVDARALVHNCLEIYRREHRRLPARVVIHKTSAFSSPETRGFESAVTAQHIDLLDQLHISESIVRLYRNGKYPPLRGTMLPMSDERVLLYTRGSVPFFQTYPGMFIPSPLDIRFSACESTPAMLCQEILALSKMGWNNTQFDRADPITIAAAREVGSILKYCESGMQIQARFAFYI